MYSNLSQSRLQSGLPSKYSSNYTEQGKNYDDEEHLSLYERKMKKIFGNQVYITPTKEKFGGEKFQKLNSLSTQSSVESNLSLSSIQHLSSSKSSESIYYSRNFYASDKNFKSSYQNFNSNTPTKLSFSQTNYECTSPISSFNHKFEQLNSKVSSFSRYINQQNESPASNTSIKFHKTSKKPVYSDRQYYKDVTQFGNGEKLSDKYMRLLSGLKLIQRQTFDPILGIFPSVALQFKMKIRA